MTTIDKPTQKRLVKWLRAFLKVLAMSEVVRSVAGVKNQDLETIANDIDRLENHMKTHLGLFEGIGGFSIAASWAGYETLAWCEIDSFCQKILKYYFPNATGHGDITTTDFTQYAGKIDLLTGGFPCQPFSVAGLQQGAGDDRFLWPEMYRAIRESKPATVICENVAGLIGMADTSGLYREALLRVEGTTIIRTPDGDDFEKIYTQQAHMLLDLFCRDLEKEGYKVQPVSVPAGAVGAPHARDRVWIVAQNPDFIRQRSIERQKESSAGQQWKPCAGNNVGICVHQGATANAEHNGQPTSKVAQSFRTGVDCKQAGKDAACKLAGCDCEQWNVANADGQRRLQSDGGAKTRFSTQNIPDWSDFPTQSPVCGGNDGVSTELVGITVASHRRQSIKAYGNAIVPQVAYQIIKAIEP